MFGYIRPCKPEMKVKEYEFYKAVYCGQCKQLGKVYGPFSRLTLSYDFAFLSLLHMALNDREVRLERQCCVVNPLVKKPICQPNEELDFTCGVAMVMLYHKMRDNLQDKGLRDKTLALLAYPFILPIYNKAGNRLPEIELAVASMMDEQRRLEEAGCSSVDEASEPTAKVMETLAVSLSKEPSQQRILHRLGYLLGRWVYLIDALDDLKEDLRLGNYNPYIQKFSLTSQRTDKIEEVRKEAKASLYLTIGEIGSTYELLEIKRYKSILDNIIHLGLKDSVDRLYLSCGKLDERK